MDRQSITQRRNHFSCSFFGQERWIYTHRFFLYLSFFLLCLYIAGMYVSSVGGCAYTLKVCVYTYIMCSSSSSSSRHKSINFKQVFFSQILTHSNRLARRTATEEINKMPAALIHQNLNLFSQTREQQNCLHLVHMSSLRF